MSTPLASGKADVTVDFDHHAVAPGTEVFDMFRGLRETCPVAWSERYGGHWIVTRHDDVGRVLRDSRHFSSTRELVPGGGTTQHIPSMDMPPMIPSELDPPASLVYRRAINPALSPQAIERMAGRVRHWVDHYLDAIADEPRADLIYAFAAPVPAAVTVEWIGLPLEDLPVIVTAYHDYFGHPPTHERGLAAKKTLDWLFGRIGELLEERRAQPRDDVLSYLVAQEIDGRPITLDEAHRIAAILVAGGVETTTTAVSWMILHLSRHHDDRRALIEDPGLWKTAADELLRRYPPVVYHARVCQEDTELGGCPVRRGERVMAVEGSACHDADEFPEPERVVLDRFPNRHLAFGLGSHRCVGMHLARLEIRVMMSELLRRFPGYRVLEDELRPYPDCSTIAGWATMPAVLGDQRADADQG